MRNRPPVLLQNSPTDDDSLAYRFSGVLPRKVAGFRIDRFFSKRRPGHLRKRVRQVHQRFRRGTFDGGRVRRMKMLWLCTRGRPLVSRDGGHPMTLLLLDSAKTPRPQPATFEHPPANGHGRALLDSITTALNANPLPINLGIRIPRGQADYRNPVRLSAKTSVFSFVRS